MSTFLNTVLAMIMTLISIIMPAKPNNIKITVRQTTTESSSIVFEVQNNTGRLMSRPNVALIEKKDGNGQWQKADFTYSWTEEYYNIYPGMSATDSVFFSTHEPDYTPPLTKGEYRLTLEYKTGNISGEVVPGKASAEFTVV